MSTRFPLKLYNLFYLILVGGANRKSGNTHLCIDHSKINRSTSITTKTRLAHFNSRLGTIENHDVLIFAKKRFDEVGGANFTSLSKRSIVKR